MSKSNLAVQVEDFSADDVSRDSMDLFSHLLGYQLKRAKSKVYDSFAVHLADIGLTTGQFGALILINILEGMSQSELSDRLSNNRSQTVRFLDSLEEKGLVERRRLKEDRRVQNVYIQPAGRDMIEGLIDKVFNHEYRIAGHMTKEELNTLVALLCKLNDG
ncbi:MAG: hypothetical protein CMM74_08280 [Rhodospirillaceae bacterium]|nr:hypothetical protein [Rhodospirillaceae bacterium]